MKCKNNNIPPNPIKKLFHFLKVRLSTLGVKITYTALLLYYAYKRPETPKWAKNVIIGSLAYLLSPIDGIPDLTPFLGFTDDIGVLSFGLVTIAAYVNEDVRSSAKEHVNRLFKKIDAEDLTEVDSQL